MCAAQHTHLDGLPMVGRHPRPLSDALLNGGDDWVSATPAAAPGYWVSCGLVADDVLGCWQLKSCSACHAMHGACCVLAGVMSAGPDVCYVGSAHPSVQHA
jgi:hypothetical protein